MRDIFFYINAAMQNSQCSSERKLCELLETGPNVITTYRRGSLPTDETMVKLARIAGIDPYIALLDLNTWRSTGAAQEAYKAILKKITTAAIVLFLLIGNGPAHAMNKAAIKFQGLTVENINVSNDIHYHIGITPNGAFKTGLPHVQAFYETRAREQQKSDP